MVPHDSDRAIPAPVPINQRLISANEGRSSPGGFRPQTETNRRARTPPIAYNWRSQVSFTSSWRLRIGAGISTPRPSTGARSL